MTPAIYSRISTRLSVLLYRGTHTDNNAISYVSRQSAICISLKQKTYQDHSCCNPHQHIDKRNEENDRNRTQGNFSNPWQSSMRMLDLFDQSMGPFAAVPAGITGPWVNVDFDRRIRVHWHFQSLLYISQTCRRRAMVKSKERVESMLRSRSG